MPRIHVKPRTLIIAFTVVSQTLLLISLITAILADHFHWQLPFPILRFSYSSADYSHLQRFISTFPKPRAGPGPHNWTDEVEPNNWWLQRTRREGRLEFNWPSIERIIVFGDSLSAESAGYHTWRNSIKQDGRLPPDAIQLDLNMLDALHILYRKVGSAYDNFAVGGTVLKRSVIPPRIPNWLDFDDEIGNFLHRYPPESGGRLNSKIKPESTLVILGPFGMNDQKIIARNQDKYQNLTSMTALVDAWISGAQQLYDMGHRHFLFLNGPPIDSSPQTTLPDQGGYADRFFLQKLNQRMNTHLALAVSEFDARNTQGNAMLFDLHSMLSLLTKWPELFGYVDTQRFAIRVGGEAKKQSLYGLRYRDSQGHSSGISSRQAATALNGFLLRHSRTFQLNRATWGELEVKR